MLFELKVRHDCHESFSSKERLFDFLRREQVVFVMYDKIKPHEFTGRMTYLGDVQYVGQELKTEKALYVFSYTMQEFEVLRRELMELQQELLEKWNKTIA